MMEQNKGMELNENELMDVNGGSWFSDAWKSTCKWCKDNSGVLVRVGCTVGGIALCATGVGAAAGAGLIAVESVAGAATISTCIGGLTGATVGKIITG